MRYVLIKLGTVVNAIEADAAFVAKISTDYDAVIPHPEASPGWTYNGVSFLPPVYGAPPLRRILTYKEFRKRLTPTEREKMYAFESAPLTVDKKNKLRVFLRDLELDQSISLDDPAIIAGVNFLEANGFLTTGRAALILAGGA